MAVATVWTTFLSGFLEAYTTGASGASGDIGEGATGPNR